MQVDFTVAIPTYNGAKRLPILLERLRSQSNPDQINWEILIVDNNSTDDTAQVVQTYQADWNENFSLRYSFEPEQGAAFARHRAVREAKADLIGFLDDDNLPDPNWLLASYSFSPKYPKAGAYSGQIHGDFEVEPPADFDKIQRFLAIRDHGPNPSRFDAANIQLPPAASLVIRKQAWNDVPPRPTLTGKLPGLFIQGDDYEPLLYMHKAGWEIWYNPDMHTYHQIPRQRLERSYLLMLARGCGLATYQLRMINAKPQQAPIIFTKTILGNLRRMLMHLLKYRGKLKTDLIPAFEMAFYRGSLESTFLPLKKKTLN
jgi:GT2 family glycosyltransferase